MEENDALMPYLASLVEVSIVEDSSSTLTFSEFGVAAQQDSKSSLKANSSYVGKQDESQDFASHEVLILENQPETDFCEEEKQYFDLVFNDGDCKKRWKYIRDSYYRFKRKRNMSTGSAAPPKNSKWAFFKRLQFLELVSTERPTAFEFEVDGTSTSNSPANAQFETQAENSEGCPNEASQSSKPPPPRRKRHNNNHDDILDYLVKWDESRQIAMQKLSANTATEIEDDIASFGNHVKAVLRKLHPRLKIQAKNDIYNILSKYEVIQMDMQEAT